MRVCIYTHHTIHATHPKHTIHIYIPYLSVLKLGSNTRRGSIICQVVQQNKRNKRLGPFKRRVPKLLNLINLKMLPNIKEN